MVGNFPKWLLCLGALALAGGLHAAEVRDMRVSTAAGHTRVVFDLSAAPQYKLFQLAGPDRIVLDLENSELAARFQTPGDTGVIKRVRSGHHGDKGLRLVLDLDTATHPKSFLLKPTKEHGYRLVLDMYSDPTVPVTTPQVVDSPKARKVVVAIDAGHGGIDPGASGAHGTKEKDITLKVARDLAREINAQEGMQAVLTRTNDEFIPLKRRYQIAREHNADLFISIHADAFRNRDARGSSVWVLSPRGKSSEAARWLADRENRADLVGGVSLDDKDDTLAAVLLDLSQGASMQISNVVANNVLKALARLGPTHRGHVEHANFVVLRSPDVPSILVETAFISNPYEERQLRSPEHRKKLASAILNGVKNYFEAAPPTGTWFALQARERGEQHVVTRGETLSAIASQYGISMAKLQQANDLANTNNLQAGIVLRIPTG